MNSEVVYKVALRGNDAYEDIYASLEKPIEYLKNKTDNDKQSNITLSDNTRQINSKDAFSNNILVKHIK